MRGEPWLERTGRERERKGFSPRSEWKDDERRCEKYRIQASPVPACVRSAVFPDFQVSSARIPECSSVASPNLKCIIAFLLRERKDVLLEVAKELEVEVDITLPKMEFKKRICQSKYYTEVVAKCLLEGILEEKREEREKREIKKFEERRLAREFELERLRAQLSNKLNENELKAWNRINNLANICILSEKRTTEVSEPVNKCRPLINPVVNKSVENATSCDFENENCDPPVRWTNVSPLSEVRGRGTEKNNSSKGEKRVKINVYRSSDCEVKMKVGVCEGRVRAVAMGAQWVINPDNIGNGSFELKGDKGVENPEGLICENICEEKYTIGTLMGCEKQLTVDQESFRNHTMAKIAGQLNGEKENMCKADVRKGLEDGLAMRLPLSEPREIYKDNLETDNRSNIGSEFKFDIDLPGKRDRSTIYRLNLIKLYRRKPELANLVMENSSEGIYSETLYSVKLFMDFGFQERGRKENERKKKRRRERDEPGLEWRKGKSLALDGESMRGEPWLERTGRERERKGFSPRSEWKDDERWWR
ncbi:uncharacterized protein TNCV_5110781 [Trichonephila clavipes]|nr:uncharacterized protein TNCV_5110781 [Trichonephila clavipes]